MMKFCHEILLLSPTLTATTEILMKGALNKYDLIKAMYGDERLAVMLSESVSQSTKGVGFYCYFFSEYH
jgi:hypothetical protein